MRNRVNINNDITSGISSNIFKLIEISIEKNNKEAFQSLLSFTRRMLIKSVENESLQHFSEYVEILPLTYYKTFLKASENALYKSIHNISAELIPIYLKETIWFDIGFKVRHSDSLIEIEKLNKYFYMAFSSFNKLFYFMINNHDYEKLKAAIDEFDQIDDLANASNYELKFTLRQLRKSNSENNETQILNIEHEIAIRDQYNTFNRLIIKGLKYWLIFLFQVNKIDSKTCKDLIGYLPRRNSNPEDTFNDILFLRNLKPHFYFNWTDWDFIERKSGKLYTPADPREWMTLGFFIEQLIGDGLFIDRDQLNVKALNEAKYLQEDIIRFKDIVFKNVEKWGELFNDFDVSKLDTKYEQLLSVLSSIKRIGLSNVESQIANASLDSDLISEFVTLLGNCWEKESNIRILFNKFGNTELIESDKIKLRQIGNHIFFEKAKMMFVKDHYQMIYGVERMGGQVGRWEDTEFFNTIFKEKPVIVEKNTLLELVESCLLELELNNILPNLILVDHEMAYSINELDDSGNFVSNISNLQPDLESDRFFIGFYKNIPIYYTFSEFLKNSILVCDFKKAFKMRYKKNKDWFKEIFQINVKPVTDEDAQRKLNENPLKWKKTDDNILLSDEEALTLIKTSVILEYKTILDFIVLDKTSYLIGSKISSMSDSSL